MQRVSAAEVLAARPAKNAVDPWRPYAFHVEREYTSARAVEDVATIFLTNRECPFRCVMCDLWKNTSDDVVPVGAIPAQIEFALSRLPPARHIKLYNAGNFHDPRAIPPVDHDDVIRLVRGFSTVIIENRPRFIDEGCVRFRDRLGTRLEVAIGLETAHPDVLAALNKGMTLDDCDRAVALLTRHGIEVRAFVLLKPPFLGEIEAVTWAIRSIDHAFAAGAACCVLIPVRGGNGVMERLAAAGQFAPPRLASLERVMDEVLPRAPGRLFVDLWDIGRIAAGEPRADERVARLQQMNLTQRMTAPGEIA